MRDMKRWWIGLLCAVAALACDDGDGGGAGGGVVVLPDPSGMGGAGGAPDPDMQVDPPDAAPVDAALDIGPDMAPDMAPPPAPDICETQDLTRRALQPGADTFNFGDIAGDFTVQTLRGSWTLSEEWTGCESYVFLVYFPDLRQGGGGAWIGDQLWDSDVAPLLQVGPGNTHYFFVSFEEDPVARMTRVDDMRRRVIASLPLGLRLPDRMHFVTDRLTEIEGSVGAFVTDYLEYMFDPASVVDLGDRGQAQPPLPFSFGIDRLQRWDAGGSLAEVVGRPMIWRMAAYFGRFYNHIARTYERAETDGATEVVLVDDMVTERVFNRTVTLPDAAAMDAFDTVEVDVSVTCPHRNVFACSEWDRIARIDFCLDAECMERREMVRWITPYWRRGERRWIWDASAFRAWLTPGGEQTFRIEMGPGWERATERHTRMALRLRTAGDRPKSVGAEPAFGGGEFNADYNTREPLVFTPPADATKVELVVILSGHGQTEGNNCAEWCDHRHHFTVNDVALDPLRHDGRVGSLAGCADAARDGVSPGQFGNWAPERAFWCPGLPVTPIHVDITEHVQLGMENQLTYRGTLRSNTEPRGGNIALSSYVVYSR